MNKTNVRAAKAFVLFLVFVAVYGAIVALANQMLRSHGYASVSSSTILIASTIYVLYLAWKWLCRKLDLIGKGAK